MGQPPECSGPGDLSLQEDRQVALRRCVLGVSVIDGIDAFPDPDGVRLLDGIPMAIGWPEIDEAVGNINPDSARARTRLRMWFRLRSQLEAISDVRGRARAMALPRGHALHPGADWARVTVPGGLIDLGVGLLGLLDDPDEVVVIPPALARAANLPVEHWWPELVCELEVTARKGADRFSLDDNAPLRRFGDYDVVTLLASSTFREVMCAVDPIGWRTAAVPMRHRGWLDLARIDPAFAAAAALATEPDERGFARAIIVTPEEVVLVPPGGNAAEHALLDPPIAHDPWIHRM